MLHIVTLSNMKSIFLSILGIVCCLTTFGQKPKKAIKKLGDNPIFFIDSVNVDNSELMKYGPTEIAQVTVYKDKEAKDLFGEEGKDGVVYILTKKYAKSKYWQYFQSKSDDYKKLVTSPEGDTAIQYILNERILKENFEGDLFLIDDTVFKSIRVLTKDILEKEFKIFDKELGFQIRSDIPENLYRGQKKF